MLFGAGVAVGGEGDTLVDDEFGESLGVLVGGDAEDESVARGDVLVKAVQGGSFFDAGWAPTGPEVEDYDFATEIGQMAGLTIEIESEILGGLASEGGFALAIGGEREGDNEADDEDQDGPSGQSSAESHDAILTQLPRTGNGQHSPNADS